MISPSLSNQPFALHACCVPVKGAKRSILYDLNRNEFEYIPTALYNVLTRCRGMSLKEIKLGYGSDKEAVLDEYFEFLLEKEYIFFTDSAELACFPELDHRFETPALISNALIDIGVESPYQFSALVSELAEVGCRDLQLRTFQSQPLDFYISLFSHLSGKGFRSVELIASYHESFVKESLLNFVREFPFTALFLVHTSPVKQVLHPARYGMHLVYFETEPLIPGKEYLLRNPSYFTVSNRVFSEAQQFHTHFNRKVTVDINGLIRNGQYGRETFGFIGKRPLKSVIQTADFQKLWHVRKDDTRICRDCEYRYMCMDNRVPVKNQGETEWAHETPCLYNPYRARWNNPNTCT